jgi:hypothetical protein
VLELQNTLIMERDAIEQTLEYSEEFKRVQIEILPRHAPLRERRTTPHMLARQLSINSQITFAIVVDFRWALTCWTGRTQDVVAAE